MAEINGYLDLIPSANRYQPNFIAAVSASIQPFIDAQNVALSLQTIFDLFTAVGQQLDMVGEWVGITRFIAEPLEVLWFSWGVAGAGWGQADWQPVPAQPTMNQIVRLDDNHYRILLKATVAANYWDGTIEGAYTAWNTLFAPEGFQILIQNAGPKRVPWFAWGDRLAGWGQSAWAPLPLWDQVLWDQFVWDLPNQYASDNMHIILAIVGPPLDALTKALFEGGYLDLKGAGVMIDYYATQTVSGVPIFAWGVGPNEPATCPPVTLGGWGVGAWANVSQAGS